MAHKFLTYPAPRLDGDLIYSESDKTFAFRPRNFDDLAESIGAAGRTSLVVDTLQLETAVETGRALYVWGYLPKSAWEIASLTPPESKASGVCVELDDQPLEESISVSIARSNWSILFDENSGLVHMTHNRAIHEELIEIANDVHLGLNGTELNSFWLAPKFVA